MFTYFVAFFVVLSIDQCLTYDSDAAPEFANSGYFRARGWRGNGKSRSSYFPKYDTYDESRPVPHPFMQPVNYFNQGPCENYPTPYGQHENIEIVGGPMRIAKEGAYVDMQCLKKSGHNYALKWLRQNSEGFLTGIPHGSMEHNGRLIFSKIEKVDQGFYICMDIYSYRQFAHVNLQIDFEKGNTESGKIDVAEAYMVKLGDKLELTCAFDEDANNKITWHRRNGQLPEGSTILNHGKQLRLNHVKLEDGGVYFCEKLNEKKDQVEVSHDIDVQISETIEVEGRIISSEK